MKELMRKIRRFFSTNKMKYGANAAVLTAAFIAILIVINLIVGQFPMRKDLTKNQMFSFSEQTVNILNELQQPVNIYALYGQGQENPFVMEILERYNRYSRNIEIEVIDSVKSPGFVSRYDQEGKGISNGSFIVENPETGNFRIIRSFELVAFSHGSQSADSLVAEQRFTSAIMYVSTDKTPTVYFVEGHGQSDLSAINADLERENYEIKTLNLVTEDIPEDADVLIIAAPTRDFGADEINEKLDKFFDVGGGAIFLFDPAREELPILEDYLREWGVALNRDIVVEGNTNRFFRVPTFLVPVVQSHEITGIIRSNNLMMIMPNTTSMDILFNESESIKVNSLLKTSNNSWGKTDLESIAIGKEDGDIQGPLDIAVAITRANYDVRDNYRPLKETKIVVVGNSSFLGDEVLGLTGHANVDFFMNTLNWMQDEETRISIRPKSLRPERMNITSYSQVLTYAALVVIVIPLIIFILGGVVWLRRRHL